MLWTLKRVYKQSFTIAKIFESTSATHFSPVNGCHHVHHVTTVAFNRSGHMYDSLFSSSFLQTPSTLLTMESFSFFFYYGDCFCGFHFLAGCLYLIRRGTVFLSLCWLHSISVLQTFLIIADLYSLFSIVHLSFSTPNCSPSTRCWPSIAVRSAPRTLLSIPRSLTELFDYLMAIHCVLFITASE